MQEPRIRQVHRAVSGHSLQMLLCSQRGEREEGRSQRQGKGAEEKRGGNRRPGEWHENELTRGCQVGWLG